MHVHGAGCGIWIGGGYVRETKVQQPLKQLTAAAAERNGMVV
jgi:hypothetical protein